MLCDVEVGRYMFRVGKDLESEALARPRVRPMDITGMPMRGFVWVSAEASRRPMQMGRTNKHAHFPMPRRVGHTLRGAEV